MTKGTVMDTQPLPREANVGPTKQSNKDSKHRDEASADAAK